MADPTISDGELSALRNEIRLCDRLIESTIKPQMLEAIRRYIGDFTPTMAVDWTIVLNEIYPIIQYNLPSIFFRNPKVFLKPRSKHYIAKKRNPQTGQLEELFLDSQKSAVTQEHVLNYKMDQIRYKQESRKVLLDALLFKHGILWHGYKGDFGMTDERSFYIRSEDVFVQRISPAMFLHDPAVAIDHLEEGEWVGRKFLYRLSHFLEDDRLHIVNKRDIKGKIGYQDRIAPDIMPGENGKDTIVPGSQDRLLIDFADKDFKDSPFSKFLTVYEIIKRPTPKEKRNGEKGKVLLLTMDQFRPHRLDWFDYKAEGWPSKVLQFNPVPDSQYGLADIKTYDTIADHKNLVINQQIRNADQLNKVWVGLAKDSIAGEEDVEKIRAGKNTIIFFDAEEVKDRMFVANAGAGASSELYLLDQRIEKNLQDKSGVSDLKRGFLQSGEESAASVKLRAAGSSARPAYRQDIMADFLRESTLYLNQLIKQYLSFDDAVRIVGSLDIEWSEKPTKESLQADVDVEIDVTSMAPESPEKELTELTTVLNLMTTAVQSPDIFSKLQQEGKMFNLAPIIEHLLLRLRIRNPDVFRNIRPEESQGYVSVSELRAAEANINAVMSGQEPPSIPESGQDHAARLEIYTAIQNLIAAMGQTNAMLDQLILLQQAVMQADEEKESPRTNSPLKNPATIQVAEPVGSVG